MCVWAPLSVQAWQQITSLVTTDLEKVLSRFWLHPSQGSASLKSPNTAGGDIPQVQMISVFLLLHPGLH